ncbi:MAG TPA: hypothetical protein VFD32_08690 [Dehalococcoidia bacterium]|nr:hypothetical protein [Dehalococcoidia bacterium]
MATDPLTEAEKLAQVPGIVYVDGPVGRRARVAGSGLDVWEVISAWLGLDRRAGAVQESYPWLTLVQIKAAIRFYTLFPEEIDRRLAREREIDRIVEEAGGMSLELLYRLTDGRDP